MFVIAQSMVDVLFLFLVSVYAESGAHK